MSKIAFLFYACSVVIIILFAVFSYLMTTVNPKRIENNNNSKAPSKLAQNAGAEKDAVKYDEGWANAERNFKVKRNATTGSSRKSMKFSVDAPEWMTNSTAGSFDTSSVNASVERNPTSTNGTVPSKSSKGRRSIKEQRKNKRGIVVMRIIGEEGKPRIEIVLHPKRSESNKWNGNSFDKGKYQNHELIHNSVLNIMPDDRAILGNGDLLIERHFESDNITSLETSGKMKTTELIQNSILNIMPNNVVNLENVDYSFKPNLPSDHMTSAVFTSEKAKTTEGVFHLKNNWINPINMPMNNEGVTKLNVYSSSYTTKIMPTTVDSQTMFKKNNSREVKINAFEYSTKNILPFTFLNFDIVRQADTSRNRNASYDVAI